MTILIKILQFFMAFSILIIIHELGHFVFARIFKMRVEKFYLFFDPWFSIFKFKKGDTEYGLGWLPLGGYVKISGMIDESLDTEQMTTEPQPWEFRAKAPWKRFLTMIGGVMFNVLLAIIIYAGISYVWGKSYNEPADIKFGYTYTEVAREAGFRDGDRIIDIEGVEVTQKKHRLFDALIEQASYVTVLRDGAPVRIDLDPGFTAKVLDSGIDPQNIRIPFVIDSLATGGAAAVAGIMPGDSLVALNNEPMMYFDQFAGAFKNMAGDTAVISLFRESNGVLSLIEIPVRVSDEGKIDVYIQDAAHFIPERTQSYNLIQAIPAGFNLAFEQAGSYWKQLKMVFTPKTEAYKSLGGIITIGNFFPGEWDWLRFWSLTAFLSIVLAIMNLLPIPGLDGGHAMFTLYEMITGRKPSDKFMIGVQYVGMFIIFALLIYVTGNDIYRFFIK